MNRMGIWKSYSNRLPFFAICDFIFILGSLVSVHKLQCNPDFSNPRFPKVPDNSSQKSFPLDLLH